MILHTRYDPFYIWLFIVKVLVYVMSEVSSALLSSFLYTQRPQAGLDPDVAVRKVTPDHHALHSCCLGLHNEQGQATETSLH